MTISPVDHVFVKRMYRHFQKEANTNYQENCANTHSSCIVCKLQFPQPGECSGKDGPRWPPTLEDIINYTTSLEANPLDLNFSVLVPVAMEDRTGPLISS